MKMISAAISETIKSTSNLQDQVSSLELHLLHISAFFLLLQVQASTKLWQRPEITVMLD